jgi:hypothetical protein
MQRLAERIIARVAMLRATSNALTFVCVCV